MRYVTYSGGSSFITCPLGFLAFFVIRCLDHFKSLNGPHTKHLKNKSTKITDQEVSTYTQNNSMTWNSYLYTSYGFKSLPGSELPAADAEAHITLPLFHGIDLENLIKSTTCCYCYLSNAQIKFSTIKTFRTFYKLIIFIILKNIANPPNSSNFRKEIHSLMPYLFSTQKSFCKELPKPTRNYIYFKQVAISISNIYLARIL